MELALIIAVGLVFALCGLICIATIVVGLPGAWMMLGLAVLIELVDGAWASPEHQPTFGWWLLGGCLALAGLGELLELIAGALGAKQGGSSRRGMIGAVIGGVAGGILGLGLPLPLIGSLIGAVVGTFAGAIAGELSGTDPSTMRDALRPATGATIGRVLGTIAKLPIATAIWVVLVVGAFWP
jgi:uncharacterized protein YqgC (DUF456 family)